MHTHTHTSGPGTLPAFSWSQHWKPLARLFQQAARSLLASLDDLGAQSVCVPLFYSSAFVFCPFLLLVPTSTPGVPADILPASEKRPPYTDGAKQEVGRAEPEEQDELLGLPCSEDTPPLLSSTGMSSSPLGLCSTVPQVSASPTASKPIHSPTPPVWLFFLSQDSPLILPSSHPPVAPPHPHPLSCGHLSPPTFQLQLCHFLWILPRRCCLDFSHWFFLVQPGTKNQQLSTPEPECPGLKGERRGRHTPEQPLGSGRSTGPLDNSEKGPRIPSPGTALPWRRTKGATGSPCLH